MTRSEPCMCGDPACWICGDGDGSEDMPVCPVCDGTGYLVDPLDPGPIDWPEDFVKCDYCKGTGIMDRKEQEL